MRSRYKPLATKFLFLAVAACLALPAGPAQATMESYCQYPPYVFQSVIPSIALLVSNSSSMLNFAYYDSDANQCTDPGTPCVNFDPSKSYFGYFEPDYYYSYGSNRFNRYASPKSTTVKAAADWDGNFLNWLTMRRIDILRKVLTGGTMVGQSASVAGNGTYKRYNDSGQHTPFSGQKDYTFNISASGNSEFAVSGAGTYRVNINATPPAGILQEIVGAKARIALTFYNFDDQGGAINPEIGTANPLASLVNRINTPSNIKGGDATAPLGEALWTVVGDFAQVGTTTGPGPMYHMGDYATTTNLNDPYYYNGRFSRCLKGAVVVISDGEPCGDGNLPAAFGSFADNVGSTFDCEGTTCYAAPPLFPADTSVLGCSAGGAVAGVEDVSLFAHTTDLRSTTFGKNAISGTQNLDLYFVRAFGRGSNLLKYAAINGSFEDLNGNRRPDDGEYDLSDGYYEATDGQQLKDALTDLFSKLLRRATSGTAASVLASGEGSGANLVQAVFYPRRRFGNDIIEWTGTLQNLWYYVDPFFANASIREDSCTGADCTGDRILNLANDKTAVFVFDPVTQTTKVNLYGDSNADGVPDGSPVPVSLDEVKNLWEAGELLHPKDPDTRTIFTVDGSTDPPAKLPFTTGNAATLQASLQAASSTEAAAIISYVRGKDDVNGDGVIDFRQRTVPVGTDYAVWKLGDIINSTPRIASMSPLNTYDRVYGDGTYRTFVEGTTYRNRGMVFAGGNDGMLHAFKLGKLEFAWAGQTPLQKARLTNDNVLQPLGTEQWAFVPKNALPYLRYLLDANYCHLYYADLTPYLFDASLGGPTDAAYSVRDETQWRTVLIGGMRYGGACRGATDSCTDCVKAPASAPSGLGLSSYFALDVTNPRTPSILWEFSAPGLGFTTTGPAIVRIHAQNLSTGLADRSLNGKWFAVFGSGPTGPISTRQFLGKSDQNLRLFVLDLKSGQVVRTIDTGISQAFAGSMYNSTADFDLDYQDDAVYFGYVRRDGTGGWTQGGVGRLLTNEDPDPANWEYRTVIDGVGPVTSAVARLQNNTYHANWLFFGTGRYFYELPSAADDTSSQRNLFGVKDPCFTVGNAVDPSCTAAVDPTDLTNVDNTAVSDLVANGSGFAGWNINLDTAVSVNYDGTGSRDYRSERVITDPLATASGLVFFTTYRPYGDDCALGGKSFLWSVQYNTGGVPPPNLRKGKALVQVSTASIEQLDLSDAFSKPVSGADSSLHRGGRRSISLEGVPPLAQGLSLLTPPPPVKRVLHIRER